jgi:hypothetical protein
LWLLLVTPFCDRFWLPPFFGHCWLMVLCDV